VPSHFSSIHTHIDCVKNTQKIIEALKLLAPTKARRAQEVVVNARSFSQTPLKSSTTSTNSSKPKM